MSEPQLVAGEEVRIYIHHAREMLDVAALNLAEGYHASAINHPTMPSRMPLTLSWRPKGLREASTRV
jgi:hypothetical protein